MLAAPLLAGNDIQSMTAETRSILLNKEVIELDQDTLGKQCFCFRDNGDYEIWIKKLANDEKAVCLLNKSDENKNVQVDLALLLNAKDDYWTSDGLKLGNYKIRDLWEHKDLELKETSVFINMIPHSVKVYRFIKK